MRNGHIVSLCLTPALLAFGALTDLSAEAPQRLEGWRSDLEVLSDSLLARDRSFSPSARQEFRRKLAELDAALDRLTDDAILAELSHLVALADNAHTRLRLDPTVAGAFTNQFPVRSWVFADGLYVIRTSPDYQRALACRIVAINGHVIDQVSKDVMKLFAGNDPWKDYLLPIYLESPNVLHGLGIIDNDQEALFTLEDGSGKRFDLSVHSRPVNQGWETWQELSPVFAADGLPSSCALGLDHLPLYLRHPDRAYWFEYLPATQTLYFQFNIADNAPIGPTFHHFADSLLAFTGSHAVETTIVDLRLNSGGNLEVARDFISDLGNNASINRSGHLFVIVGRTTFSAGLYHAAQLKQLTHAILVGEPAGDRLDYWAEGGMLVLPNSGAVIEYADGFHRYSLKDYPENQPYYASLSIKGLDPDRLVPVTSKDYFSGHDAAWAAIERFLPH